MIRIALLLSLLLAPSVVGQAPAARLHGETEAAQTRKRLVEAQAKLADGKTADAVDDLLRVLADSGDDLIPLPDGSHPPARRLVHRVLAGLPADALENLRDRIDAPAPRDAPHRHHVELRGRTENSCRSMKCMNGFPPDSGPIRKRIAPDGTETGRHPVSARWNQCHPRSLIPFARHFAFLLGCSN